MTSSLSLSLQPGEQIIWSDIKKAGIIHRRVVQVLAITNYNIILWKEGNPQTTIPIYEISNVVVLDRRSSASSNHLTYSYGSRRFRNYNNTKILRLPVLIGFRNFILH